MVKKSDFPDYQLSICDLNEDLECPLCGQFHSCCTCEGYFYRKVKLLQDSVTKLKKENKRLRRNNDKGSS